MIKKQLFLPYRLPLKLFEDFKAYLPCCAEEIIDVRLCDEHLEIDYAGERYAIEAAALKLLDALCDTGDPGSIERKVVFDNRSVVCQNQRGIFDDLLTGGHLIKFGEGQYGMGKTFLTVFKYFERACYRLALQQNPDEYVYPIMIPIHFLRQCDYPNTRATTFFSRSEPGINPAEPSHAGKAAVCLHCYPHFENKVITQPVTLTTQGRCYRYEPGRMETDEIGNSSPAVSPAMENLWEFIMRESIYLGSASFVRTSLAEIRRLTEEWMVRLNMRCWIETADDPFFAEEPAIRRKTRMLKDSKYELRISLPEISLAAASFNFHGPHFSRAFNITDGKNYVATGCAGFGIERLTYAFLSQYGLQTGLWPQPIQDEVLAKP